MTKRKYPVNSSSVVKKNILLMQDYRKATVTQIMTFAEEHL